jgi:hypothetical protein
MCLPPPAPDSIALVTGASSGIGEQYAQQPQQMDGGMFGGGGMLGGFLNSGFGRAV